MLVCISNGYNFLSPVRRPRRKLLTVTQIPAAHRRLIRRRILSELSSPSPPKAMGKKKPKKSPASKKSLKSSPSSKSPKVSPIQEKPIHASDVELDPTFLASEGGFDALIDSPINEVAQPPQSLSDSISQAGLSTPATEVIVGHPTDPSAAQEGDPSTPTELSSEIAMTSSPVTLPEMADNSAVLQNAGDSSIVASADAKSNLPSSQQADDNNPIPTQETEARTTATPANESESTPQAPVSEQKLQENTTVPPKDSWCDLAKGKKLSKKGEAFTLPSGEACIKIPNSIIEKNRKSWEPFVLGQFYSDPPSQGTLHNIVNGIWSKNYRDIAVSKMEGFAFLFRIPNAATRARVVKQKLWQIEGQTMFVDKWEPGVVPTKPELTSAPIWLELRKVPLQFFNEDGLERIAGLVGHPKFLHPMTANKTNLEVAKVFTIIDPRKPLPEAVNVQF